MNSCQYWCFAATAISIIGQFECKLCLNRNRFYDPFTFAWTLLENNARQVEFTVFVSLPFSHLEGKRAHENDRGKGKRIENCENQHNTFDMVFTIIILYLCTTQLFADVFYMYRNKLIFECKVVRLLLTATYTHWHIQI